MCRRCTPSMSSLTRPDERTPVTSRVYDVFGRCGLSRRLVSCCLPCRPPIDCRPVEHRSTGLALRSTICLALIFDRHQWVVSGLVILHSDTPGAQATCGLSCGFQTETRTAARSCAGLDAGSACVMRLPRKALSICIPSPLPQSTYPHTRPS